MATPQNNNNYPPFASWTSATFAYSAVVNLPLPPFSAFARWTHVHLTSSVRALFRNPSQVILSASFHMTKAKAKAPRAHFPNLKEIVIWSRNIHSLVFSTMH